jgi:hypothetical protein
MALHACCQCRCCCCCCNCWLVLPILLWRAEGLLCRAVLLSLARCCPAAECSCRCAAAGAAKLQGKTFPGAADSDDADGELPELNSDDIIGEVDSGEARAHGLAMTKSNGLAAHARVTAGTYSHVWSAV